MLTIAKTIPLLQCVENKETVNGLEKRSKWRDMVCADSQGVRKTGGCLWGVKCRKMARKALLFREKVPRFCIKKLRVLKFFVGVFVRNSNEYDLESLKMPEKTPGNLWKALKSVQKWKCQSVSKNVGFAYSQVVAAKG